MGTFIGGSAYAMAKEIMEGYILLSPTFMKKYTDAEIVTLRLELEKFQREIRSEKFPLDDIEALKKKNRKIQRTSSALMTIKNFLQSRR